MVNKESNQQKAYEIFGLKLEDMGIHNVELSSLENSEKNEALIELANLKILAVLVVACKQQNLMSL